MTKGSHGSAALLPNEASTLLYLVAALFALGGTIALIVIVLGLLGVVLQWGPLQGVPLHPFSVVLNTTVAVGYLWIARLLMHGRLAGGYLALAVLGLSVLGSVITPGPLNWAELVLPGLGLVAVVLAWSHLTSAPMPAS